LVALGILSRMGGVLYLGRQVEGMGHKGLSHRVKGWSDYIFKPFNLEFRV